VRSTLCASFFLLKGSEIMLNITKKTSTTNTTSLPNRSIKYIVIHYTAGVTSKAGTAASTASYFSNASVKASADFIVDDGTIV
jgi:N-acetylmuramoyl-L-alanine amidase CwlA